MSTHSIVPPDHVVERSGAGETYIISPQGEKLIAASVRKDGSIRKAIKVRPGFMPIEEQSRYKSQAARIREGIEAARSRPPGLDYANDDHKYRLPPGAAPPSSVAAPSHKKKSSKNASSKAHEPVFEIEEPSFAASPEEPTFTDSLEPGEVRPGTSEPDVHPQETEVGGSGSKLLPSKATDDADVKVEDVENRIKFLKKKLAEAKQLKKRQEQGHHLLMNQEDKVARLGVFQLELSRLEEQLSGLRK